MAVDVCPDAEVSSDLFTEAFCEGCGMVLKRVRYNLTRSEWDIDKDIRKAVIGASLLNHKCSKNPRHTVVSVRFVQRHDIPNRAQSTNPETGVTFRHGG